MLLMGPGTCVGRAAVQGGAVTARNGSWELGFGVILGDRWFCVHGVCILPPTHHTDPAAIGITHLSAESQAW